MTGPPASGLARHVRFLAAALGARPIVVVVPPEPGSDGEPLADSLGDARVVTSDTYDPVARHGGTLVVVRAGAAVSRIPSGGMVLAERADGIAPDAPGFATGLPLANAPGGPVLTLAVDTDGPPAAIQEELAALALSSQRIAPCDPIPAAGGSLLYALAWARRSVRALEIGTGAGAAALWLATALAPAGGRLVSIERDSARHAEAAKRLRRCGLAHVVDLRLGDAERVLRRVEGRFDLVFLDADPLSRADHLGWTLRRVGSGALVVSRGSIAHAHELRDYHAFLRTLAAVKADITVAAADGLSLALLA